MLHARKQVFPRKANVVPRVGKGFSVCGRARQENLIAFPVKFAYFYKSKACYENNGLCALWEGVNLQIWSHAGVLRALLEDHMAAIAQ